MDTNYGNSIYQCIQITNQFYILIMTEQEVIDRVCDRVVNTIYNELDYYMFEELGFMETNDEYVEYADKLIVKIIKELNK